MITRLRVLSAGSGAGFESAPKAVQVGVPIGQPWRRLSIHGTADTRPSVRGRVLRNRRQEWPVEPWLGRPLLFAGSVPSPLGPVVLPRPPGDASDLAGALEAIAEDFDAGRAVPGQ